MFATNPPVLSDAADATLLPAPPPVHSRRGEVSQLSSAAQEAAHVFGLSRNLVGISVRPAASAQQDLCVIMLTAGMLHHVGPYRLHVELANHLAAIGVASFRFDLSGIGESVAVGSANDSIGRAVDESRQAMDFLNAQYGFKRFILFGLCSGADDAIQVATADRRVRSAILMDGCGFRTAGYYAHRLVGRYLPKLLNRKKLLGKRCAAVGQDHGIPLPASLADGDDIREFPDRITAAAQIQGLVDRGTSLLFVYTGGAHAYFNHHRQFRAMFPELHSRGRICVVFRPWWDHVAYLPEDRQQLVDEVLHWVQARH